MTTVTIKRLDDSFHFRASNQHGCVVDMDNASDRDGAPKGVGPMQLLLMALGGCSGIDVVSILNKARQQIDSFEMEVNGERTPLGDATPYSAVHATYRLTGKLEPDKVVRAIRLSIEKYCSVSKTMEELASITFSCWVNDTQVH